MEKGNLHVIKRILAVSAVGSVGLLGMTALPASAAATGPNVNLKVKGDVVKFKPGSLSVKATKVTPCKVTRYSFTITNKTNAAQNVDENEVPFTTIPPGGETFVCQSVGTITYSVPSSGATLTVKAS